MLTEFAVFLVLDKFVSQVSKVNFLFPRRERRPEEKQVREYYFCKPALKRRLLIKLYCTPMV